MLEEHSLEINNATAVEGVQNTFTIPQLAANGD